MPAKDQRPLRVIWGASPKSDPRGTVWGLTLACGHYVERAQVTCSDSHPRAKCDDCGKHAPPCAPALVVCTVCNVTPDGYGAPGCGACYGFGRVERNIAQVDLMTGPRPGQAPGDHVLGVWIMNLNGALLTTTIAKRGRNYIGEHMRACVGDPSQQGLNMEMLKQSPGTSIEHQPGGIIVIRDRFFPTSNLSQDFLLQNSEEHFRREFDRNVEAVFEEDEELLFKRAFIEVRSTHRARYLSIEENIVNSFMEEG